MRLRKIAYTLVLVLMALTLWWAYDTFQSRYLRPFDNQTALFDGTALRLPPDLAGPGPIRLVHFWDPACPCNVGNQQHLAELTQRFPQVAFHVVQKPGTHGQLPATLKALQPLQTMPGSEHLPASPAVAIFDRNGELAYFGPYSEGATCNADNSFIEPALKALEAGRKPQVTHTLAVGCYCPWSP